MSNKSRHSNRRGTKRRGMKRRGTKRRGTKRRGGSSKYDEINKLQTEILALLFSQTPTILLSRINDGMRLIDEIISKLKEMQGICIDMGETCPLLNCAYEDIHKAMKSCIKPRDDHEKFIEHLQETITESSEAFSPGGIATLIDELNIVKNVINKCVGASSNDLVTGNPTLYLFLEKGLNVAVNGAYFPTPEEKDQALMRIKSCMNMIKGLYELQVKQLNLLTALRWSDHKQDTDSDCPELMAKIVKAFPGDQIDKMIDSRTAVLTMVVPELKSQAPP